MKEITKHRLKQVNRLLEIGLLTFCWLMACVGVTACSIYWLRKNANYEQENSERSFERENPLRRVDDNDYYVLQLKSNDFYRHEFSTQDTIDYFSVVPTTSTAQFVAVYGDYYYDNDNYTQIYIEYGNFYDITSQGVTYTRYHVKDISLYQDNGTHYTFYQYDDSVYHAGTFLSNGTSYRLNKTSGLIVNDVNAYLDYIFSILFSPLETTSYTLDFNNFNPTKLLSYSRLTGYDMIVTGDGFGTTLELPLYFVYNGKIYTHILFHCQRVVYFLDTDGSIITYNDKTGSISSYLEAVTDVYFLEFGGTYQNAQTSTDQLYTYLQGNGLLQVAFREVAFYSGYSPSQGVTHQRPVFNFAKGWNTYRNVTYNLDISNTSLENVPFPTSSSSETAYPLSNLTTKEILDYIASNNNEIYGNVGINGDIGLRGVFTLLKGAFSGLVGIMAIQVIPGITLGLLLFMPLVVTIIIVILRLVKK